MPLRRNEYGQPLCRICGTVLVPVIVHAPGEPLFQYRCASGHRTTTYDREDEA